MTLRRHEQCDLYTVIWLELFQALTNQVRGRWEMEVGTGGDREALVLF